MTENLAVYYNLGHHSLNGRKMHCSCGYKCETKMKQEKMRKDFVCPSCDNSTIFYLEREYKTKIVTTEIIPLEINLKSFKLLKKKYRMVFHKDGSMSVKHISDEQLSYSLFNGFVIEQDGVIKDSNYKHVNLYFKGMKDSDVIDLISDPKIKGLYEFAYDKLYDRGRGWSYNKSVGYGLDSLSKENMRYLETLYFSGFTNPSQLEDVKDPYYVNWKATKPHEILNCPKPFLPILKRLVRLSSYDIKHMVKLADEIGINNFIKVFEIMIEESELHRVSMSNFCSYFIDLYSNYGFSNTERLAIYVCRDIKLQQGIESPADGLSYLKDYARMMTDLGYSFEKYSKSLKKDHDIATLNFKIMGDKIFTSKLAEKVKEDEYKFLEMKGKDYSIVSPIIADDVIKEGESLSHCVASYVKDIGRGLCKIVFLRKTEFIDDSVVTIEVRGNNVKQVRGKSNRMPTTDEKEFVKKWAEKKKLNVTY